MTQLRSSHAPRPCTTGARKGGEHHGWAAATAHRRDDRHSLPPPRSTPHGNRPLSAPFDASCIFSYTALLYSEPDVIAPSGVREGGEVATKNALKRLVRPIVLRMATPGTTRLDRHIAASVHSAAEFAAVASRLDQLEQTLLLQRSRLSEERNRLLGTTHRLSTDVEHLANSTQSLERHLPAVLNLIASKNASTRDHERRIGTIENSLLTLNSTIEALQQQIFDRLTSTSDGIAYLEKRIETIRKETLFELRYGSGEAPPSALHEAEPRVTAPHRYATMKDTLRLNLGAGHVTIPDYVNVDKRDLPGIDIVAEADRLPFDSGEVSEIYSAHFLEHFPVELLKRKLLPYWVSLLKEGGRFVAIVPDVEAMTAAVAEGSIPWDDYIEVIYGGQEYDGDFHFSGFTRDSLVALLQGVGLTKPMYRETGRPNGMCLEMEIEAIRRQ